VLKYNQSKKFKYDMLRWNTCNPIIKTPYKLHNDFFADFIRYVCTKLEMLIVAKQYTRDILICSHMYSAYIDKYHTYPFFSIEAIMCPVDTF